ncbi:MAG: hypothetical protein J6U05_02420, partial [Neisseriaceae bacterium]|nr:hypothetical protein [Neisseriaceae bacterium]
MRTQSPCYEKRQCKNILAYAELRFRQPLSSLRAVPHARRGNLLIMENAPNDFYACSTIFISSSVKLWSWYTIWFMAVLAVWSWVFSFCTLCLSVSNR